MEKDHFELLLERVEDNTKLALEGISSVSDRLDRQQAQIERLVGGQTKLEAGQTKLEAGPGQARGRPGQARGRPGQARGGPGGDQEGATRDQGHRGTAPLYRQ